MFHSFNIYQNLSSAYQLSDKTFGFAICQCSSTAKTPIKEKIISSLKPSDAIFHCRFVCWHVYLELPKLFISMLAETVLKACNRKYLVIHSLSGKAFGIDRVVVTSSLTHFYQEYPFCNHKCVLLSMPPVIIPNVNFKQIYMCVCLCVRVCKEWLHTCNIFILFPGYKLSWFEAERNTTPCLLWFGSFDKFALAQKWIAGTPWTLTG